MPQVLIDPMLPQPFRIERVRRELPDTFSWSLAPEEGTEGFHFLPGQFNMLYQFGVGEVPVSISGDAGDPSSLIHTIRAVGTVTDAMAKLKKGDVVGLRGPFGTPWPMEKANGQDVVVVTGGIGLAPLRPAIYHLLANRHKYGKIVILFGARTPKDMLYRRELEKWRSRFDISVEVTVDQAGRDWSGNVGVVPNLIGRAGFDPLHTTALVCGPEVMIHFTIKALNEAGVADKRIYVSMERNMKCAIGFCGHCQWGPNFVCKDGPVFRYDKIRKIFAVREI
jgi:NAD(P)H-flavin reductase